MSRALLVLLMSISFSVAAAPPPAIDQALDPIVQAEMRDWGIQGIAIALVDDQTTVYARGYGEAHRDSLFRCGSISKLFNAIAVLQQVEAGRLDLDAPLDRYGADLVPLNPFPEQPAVTLRHILSHRSGCPREGTVGGYLDGTQPGLARTVDSVASSVLVTRPGEKTRYSNLAPSIAGALVARVSGEPFEQYQARHLLAPLQMTQSAWKRSEIPRGRLITSHMRVADGRGGWIQRKAPVFDLGTIPAGNLFSTVDDLARFLSALIRSDPCLVTPPKLAEMWRPQFTTAETGFGLGFSVGKFRHHRSVGHSGAVYGHSTSVVLLPDAKVGVVVLGNEDIVNARIRHIANAALSLLLEAKLGEPATLSAAGAEQVVEGERFAGDFESQSYWAQLEIRDGKLVGDLSGQPTRFRHLGGLRFTAHSRIEDGTPVQFEQDPTGRITGFSLGAADPQIYRRVMGSPAPLSPEWRALLGSYGPRFAPVVIHERYGHLYAMTENMVDYRLTPLNRHACGLPPGMYVDEHVVFLTNPRGECRALDFANMVLKRW